MVAAGGGAVYCVVGSCGASGAVVDVAPGESVGAGEIAGSYQFVAGVDGNGGGGPLFMRGFGGGFAYGADYFARWGRLFRGGGVARGVVGLCGGGAGEDV